MSSILSIFIFFTLFQTSLSQNQACNSILLQYKYNSGKKIPPNETNPLKQPYNFESTITITNNGLNPLKSWEIFVGFQYNELLVTHSNAVIVNGESSMGRAEFVGNGTVFAGYPNADLKTAIDTAGDVNQYSTKIELVGTQFGVGPKTLPLPKIISLANHGYNCKPFNKQVNGTMEVCCIEDPNFKSNITAEDEFLPREIGDLTIMYDITNTWDERYKARVTIENHNPLGRLDYWKLSWSWMNREFISKMKGAYTDSVDYNACIYGPQGQYYKGTDFSDILNCEQRPTIMDLPLDKTSNTDLGMIPYCCRNGTILPKSMDPEKSKSVFELEVYKMPPDLNRTVIHPPQSWVIEGTLNPDYLCGKPFRVSPSLYPDSSGLPVNKSSIASWQVVCNITKTKGSNPKCCVSFSAYYNESIVPCQTCACGCSSSSSQSCSTTSPALLHPYQALLLPFDNRTNLITAWAKMKHRPTPNPLPCGDNCGVSIHWHLYSDYSKGWTSRITIFNWDETSFVDWFAAVEMANAAPGFEKAYAFNGTAFNYGKGDKNDTIFMQGLPNLNYIVAESDGKNPKKDPRVPGKQQSVLSFTKKNTPKIEVVKNFDGFPTKVYFNGEACSMPTVHPTSKGQRNELSVFLAVLLLWVMHIG